MSVLWPRAFMLLVGVPALVYMLALKSYDIAAAYAILWVVLYRMLLKKQSRDRDDDVG